MQKVLAAAAVLAILIAGFLFLSRKQTGESSIPEVPETSTATRLDSAPLATHGGTQPTSQALSTATSAAPAASPVPAPPSASLAPTTPPPARPPEFSEVLEKTMASLPTLDSIKALPAEEKHRTPTILIRAAAQLGDVQEMVEKDPSRVRDGMAFFNRCARREDLDDSIRAACISSLRDLGRKVGIAVDEHGLPPRLIQLVNRMKEQGN